MNLIASTAFGVESCVAFEIKKLGADNVEVKNGRVDFKGDFETVAKANMHLRCAERVFINMGEFKALTFEDLFQGTKAIAWEEFLPVDACFPVSGKSVKSTLHSVPDCQAIVKKAIVERMKSVYSQDWFEETGPLFKIEISILNDVALLTIDTSGAGLHKRGYRELAVKAPIKETLACALIDLSRWKPDRALLDPFCGSGTIAIEAAMIGKNIAPGLNREFDFEKWPCVDKIMVENIRNEAKNAVLSDEEANLRIYASDIDYFAVKQAEKNAELAGVAGCIHFQKSDYSNTASRFSKGFIVTNPPYGERLEDEGYAIDLYRGMGKHFKTFDDWSYFVITSNKFFEKYFGQYADKRRKLYNGRLECCFYQYFKKEGKIIKSEPLAESKKADKPQHKMHTGEKTVKYKSDADRKYDKKTDKKILKTGEKISKKIYTNRKNSDKITR